MQRKKVIVNTMHRFHIAIQKKLATLIPELFLEYPFPTIGRIADAVYFPEKLIFEVQCSPISLTEVQRRIRDYGSLGFEVVWVLDDRLYNKSTLSTSELYMREQRSFYASCSHSGEGFFYDKLEFFFGLKRVYSGMPHILQSLYPIKLKKRPFFFPKRFKKCTFYFRGDAYDNLLQSGEGKKAQKMEKLCTHRPTLRRLFRELFQRLLEANASSSHRDLKGQSREG